MAWYSPVTNALGSAASGFGEAMEGSRDFLLGKQYEADPNAFKLQDGGLLRGYGKQGLEQAQAGRSVPMANRAGENPFRDAQMRLMQQLQAQASGQQAGPGEMAVNRQVNQGMAAQMGQAAAARGFGGAAGALNAQRNMLGITGAGAGQAAQAGLQDRSQAQSMLGQLTQAGRGAEQQLSLADQAASLRSRGMDDQAALGYLSALTGMSQAELQAQMQREQLLAQQAAADQGLLGIGMQGLGMATQMGWKPF